MEIEEVLMGHPKRLIIDVSVAGVSGGRTDDEKVPRAWIVLSKEGEALGASETIRELEAWQQTNLSRYKWLRGGIEVVSEVSFRCAATHLHYLLDLIPLFKIPKTPSGKTLRRTLQEKYEQRVRQIYSSKL